MRFRNLRPFKSILFFHETLFIVMNIGQYYSWDRNVYFSTKKQAYKQTDVSRVYRQINTCSLVHVQACEHLRLEYSVYDSRQWGLPTEDHRVQRHRNLQEV